MTTFTLQEKLALILTSAGSQRVIANMTGASHQQIGRWLREGEEYRIDIHGNHPTNKNGTIKRYGQIPDWAANAIDTAFNIHVDISREQAHIDRVPFNATMPVYVERKPLKTGFIGDRVISGNT